MSSFVSNVPAYVAYVRKAIVNLLGLAAALLTLGLLPAPYAAYVSTGIAILTVVLHYLTPNADAPGTTAAQPDPAAPAGNDESDASVFPVYVPEPDPIATSPVLDGPTNAPIYDSLATPDAPAAS